MEFLKKHLLTVLVVGSTVVLAAIAIFTAIRLYQLRNQGTTTSKAWDCSKYTFSLAKDGTAKVVNSSSRNETSQQAKVKINGQEVQTLSVPALPAGQSATIGTVSVPSGSYTWEIIGTKDCRNNGSVTGTGGACESLAFSLAASSSPSGSPSPSPSPTASPTASATARPTASPTASPSHTPTASPSPSPTPTEPPRGGTSPTPSPTASPVGASTPTSSPTVKPTITATPKATSTPAATIPNAGVSFPTLISFSAGILLIAGAILLAL